MLLLVVAATAAAEPAEKLSRPRECKPGGGLLVEIAQRADQKAKLTTATTRLYENGSWKTEVFDVDGKSMRTRAGCLDASDVAIIRRSLRRANWKTMRTDMTCRADQPRFTLYKWKARLLYRERSCNGEVLDDDSRRALDLLALYLHAPVALDDGGRVQPPRIRPECMENPLAPGCD